MYLSPRYLERNLLSTHYPSVWVTHSYYCTCDRRAIRQCYYYPFRNWALGHRKTDHNIFKKLFRAHISINEARIPNNSSKQPDLFKVTYKYYDRTKRTRKRVFTSLKLVPLFLRQAFFHNKCQRDASMYSAE